MKLLIKKLRKLVRVDYSLCAIVVFFIFNIVQTLAEPSKSGFIENRGQIINNNGKKCPDIKYVCYLGNQILYLRDKGISIVSLKFDEIDKNEKYQDYY